MSDECLSLGSKYAWLILCSFEIQLGGKNFIVLSVHRIIQFLKDFIITEINVISTTFRSVQFFRMAVDFLFLFIFFLSDLGQDVACDVTTHNQQ